MRQNIEHIGYKVEVKGKGKLWASHPNKIRFAVSPFKGGALFMAPYELKDVALAKEEGFRTFLNNANKNCVVGRFVWADESEALFGEAWYPNAYETVAFGQFLDAWVDDVAGYIAKESEVAGRYIK